MTIPMIPTWLTAKRAVIALVACMAIALGVGSCRTINREQKAAAAAALAKEAQATADSLAKLVVIANTKARADSISAAAAARAADSATAVSDSAVRVSNALRTRLRIVSATGVRVAGDSIVTQVPAVVVAQLEQDSSTINDLQIAVMRLRIKIQRDTTEYASEHALRLLWQAHSLATDRVNAALRTEVAALKPQKCARTCGAVIGAVSVIATFIAVKR